jgi:hypothetical protein
MKSLLALLCALAATLTFAHTIKICAVVNGADVDFYAGSPHTPRTDPIGGFLIDGKRYDFTSVQNVSTNPIPADAYCVDADCPYEGNAIKFFQKVTVTGLTNGDYGVQTTCDSSTECPHCAFPFMRFTTLAQPNPCESDLNVPVIRCPTKTLELKVDRTCMGEVPNLSRKVIACDSCSEITLTQSLEAGTFVNLGEYEVLMTATDSAGNSASCTLRIKFVDKTPPKIRSLAASPARLWPPNNQMVDVAVNYNVVDNCSPNPVCSIPRVFVVNKDNDEAEEEVAADWAVVDNHNVKLRAQKSSNGGSRLYYIPVKCADDLGNTAYLATSVLVPKSNK